MEATQSKSITRDVAKQTVQNEVVLNAAYMDGEWVDIAPLSGSLNQAKLHSLYDPSSGEVIATTQLCSKAQVDTAAIAASQALLSWSQTTVSERAHFLNDIADAMEQQFDTLIGLSVLNSGKPIEEAKIDLGDAIACYRYYANLIAGQATFTEVTTNESGIRLLKTLAPVGVCALIVPWNFPMVTTSWKLAPALAAGCTVILKPSEVTLLPELMLGNILSTIGLPKGVVNILPGAAEVGTAMTCHPLIDKVSFTGSNGVGEKVMIQAAKGIKDISLGGICNSSGGMLVQRGPAYTEMALYARRSESGTFELINHLGLALGDTPEDMLNNLQSGQFGELAQINTEIDVQIKSGVDSQEDKHLDNFIVEKRTSTNQHYQDKVRDCDSATPARYNNDPSGLFEASGSAGKLIVFAVRVATFAKTTQEQTFYISTDQAEALTMLRQKWLKSDLSLPVLAEYMHKDYNDITLHYGRDTCLSMSKLPASKIGALYRLQAKVGYYLEKWHLPQTLPDRLLQLASTFMPASLPKPLASQSRAYNYHLIVKVADDNICAAQEFLQSHMQHYDGALHACTPKEGAALLVFRSAATAAMFRYHNLNHKDFGELVSTDIALPRNAIDWDETLPTGLQQQVKNCFYLGHFFCHVMHQDYLLTPGVDTKAFKEELLNFYDQRHIEYPAEHNVGHVYSAKSALNSFYKKLDPTNSLNPGIGQTAKWKNWRSTPFMEE